MKPCHNSRPEDWRHETDRCGITRAWCKTCSPPCFKGRVPDEVREKASKRKQVIATPMRVNSNNKFNFEGIGQ